MGRGSWGKPDPHPNNGDLERVLDHYGVRYQHRHSQMVSCPFHEDQTPSLSVNLDKQVFKCHSCGLGGAAVHMIAEKEGLDIRGARAFGAEHSLLSGNDEDGDPHVLGGARAAGGRAGMAGRKGNRPGDRKYAPTWRRR